jgi:hypothetical protein
MVSKKFYEGVKSMAEALSYIPENEHQNNYPMGRDNDESSCVTGYMCKTDWECEMGMASGGNAIYPSIEDLKEHRSCIGQCGIVEVKTFFSKVIQEEDYSDLFNEKKDNTDTSTPSD